MKKTLFFLLFLVISIKGMAEDISTDAVLLQALDKTTGRTSFLTAKVDEPYTYGELIVNVKKCMKHPPEETPENAAFLNVSEKEGSEIFNGWMFSSNPALSAMEHPVYDIWVVECKDKNVQQIQVLPNIELTTDTIETVDVEDLED